MSNTGALEISTNANPTKPNTLGTSWNDQFIKLFGGVRFLLVEYVRSSEGQGHDATCWWKGLTLSNSVCEYEVNPLTNDKVITEFQNF